VQVSVKEKLSSLATVGWRASIGSTGGWTMAIGETDIVAESHRSHLFVLLEVREGRWRHYEKEARDGLESAFGSRRQAEGRKERCWI
jgi:hypothetical protein